MALHAASGRMMCSSSELPASRASFKAAALAPTRTPVRGSRASRSRNVSVQANLFSRVVRLIKSTAGNLVSSAEDPEKLLDQVVEEMQNDLIKMRQAAAQVMASQKQMEAKYKQAQATADDWLRRAELAVSKNEDDLAKEALRRRKTYQDNADSMKAQLTQQQKAVDQLIGNTRILETKMAEAKSKKDTLKARSASAKTSKQIQEMIGSLDTSNSMVAFDKMEEKVMAMEAESESIGMLASTDKLLDNEFARLEGGSVEDELAALKKGTKPAAALPEGKPIKDAFGSMEMDSELEALRRKARE